MELVDENKQKIGFVCSDGIKEECKINVPLPGFI